MSNRVTFEKSVDIGCFVLLTNTYCLVTSEAPSCFLDTIESEITVPLVTTMCGQTKHTGRVCIGNSYGLIVPSFASDEEVRDLRR